MLAELREGDHFGETAIFDRRSGRNTTVSCTAPKCLLRRLARDKFEALLNESAQLNTACREAAALRSRSRLRTIIELAVANGQAEAVTLGPGETAFKQVWAAPRWGKGGRGGTAELTSGTAQGDLSESFFFVKSGRVQMSYKAADGGQVPTRVYGPGESFGASGAFTGSGVRRNTATAVEDKTELYKVPHRHLMLLMQQDTNAQSSFINVQNARELLRRGEELEVVADKVHMRDEEAFMKKSALPKEALDED